MTLSENAKQFMKDDVQKLMKDLDQTILRLQNMRLYHEEVLEALNE